MTEFRSQTLTFSRKRYKKETTKINDVSFLKKEFLLGKRLKIKIF